MINPQKIVLKNGLTILLIENHQSPVVAFNACFRVGSVYETEAEAGICHVIEHMIFKGTPKRAMGEIAATIEASGGDINAYTSFDETVYYCTVSSRYFDEGLDVLADAILNPLFDAEELEKEKPVIIEEMNRSNDTPNRVLSESLFKTLFKVHPYGRPIIGTKETVHSFTHKSLINFYRKWYVPENLVFVVAGDFNPEEAKVKIEKALSGFKKTKSPKTDLAIEPVQKTPRSVFLKKPIEGSYIQVGFPIPNITHPDLPALDVLSHLLGEGISSRLEQRIKEKKQLVTSVYSYAYTPLYPGIFVVGFTCPDSKIFSATEEVLKEIFKISQDRITHAEIARAKINIKSDAWYERETTEGLARKYGYFETMLGDYSFDEKYYQLIDEVDPEQVRAVAQKYLLPEKMNLAGVFPEKSKIRETDFKAEKLIQKSTPKVSIVKKGSTSSTRLIRLKNGVRIVLREKTDLPLVSIRLANFGGVRLDTNQKNGLHHLFAQVFPKSTTSRSSEQLAIDTETIAADVDGFSGRNADGLKGDFLSEKTREGLDLFFDVLFNPAFDSEEIEKERFNALESIRREQDQLSNIVYKNFLAKLYPKHPYGLPLLGTAETVKKLKRSDFVQVHQELLNPESLVISAVGDFDSEEMEELLSERLSVLKKTKTSQRKIELPTSPLKSIETAFKKKSEQTHIALGFLGSEMTSKDRYPLEVLNAILSGQGGRLFIELRDKQSLAYTVATVAQEGIERGFFSFYIASEPQKIEQAIEGMKKEIQKIKTEMVSEAEISRAHKYIVGSHEIDRQRASSIANQLVFNELYGLGIKEIEQYPEKILKVTREDLLHVAKKYFDLDRFVLSVVGGK